MAAGSPVVLSPTPQNSKLVLPASTDPPSEGNPPVQKTWLIFGATGHIGRSITKAALGHGDNVAAVGKAMENTLQQMQGWHEKCLGLLCDVRIRETVMACVNAAIARFGGLDIVVNCSGYGVIAACEDQDDCDLRSQFDTNFMGTLNIIQLTLPYFREQSATRKEGENAGRYLIFSSTSGALGVPGLGPYCATKYATEGLIESMLYEIDTFGIKATLVEPGHCRLDEPTGLDDKAFEGMTREGDNIHLSRYGHFFVKPASAPYDTETSPAGHAQRVVQWLADRQPSSATKSAELVWQLGHCRYPPLRLLLGSFAVESVRDRLRSINEEIEDWKHLSFPVAEEDGKPKGNGSRDSSTRNETNGDIEEGEEGMDLGVGDGVADGDVKMEEDDE